MPQLVGLLLPFLCCLATHGASAGACSPCLVQRHGGAAALPTSAGPATQHPLLARPAAAGGTQASASAGNAAAAGSSRLEAIYRAALAQVRGRMCGCRRGGESVCWAADWQPQPWSATSASRMRGRRPQRSTPTSRPHFAFAPPLVSPLNVSFFHLPANQHTAGHGPN